MRDVRSAGQLIVCKVSTASRDHIAVDSTACPSQVSLRDFPRPTAKTMLTSKYNFAKVITIPLYTAQGPFIALPLVAYSNFHFPQGTKVHRVSNLCGPSRPTLRLALSLDTSVLVRFPYSFLSSAIYLSSM